MLHVLENIWSCCETRRFPLFYMVKNSDTVLVIHIAVDTVDDGVGLFRDISSYY